MNGLYARAFFSAEPNARPARTQGGGQMTPYRLSGSHLAALKAAGVPDPVLDYMQQTICGRSESVRS